MRVLVADDKLEVRSALRLLLEQLPDVTVVGEATGTDSLLVQASALCPDLVLLDWELRGLHATELLPGLRARCPRLSVIVLSSRPENQRPALANGADAFVSKGDAPEQLLKAVSDCSDKHRMYGRTENNQEKGGSE